MPPFALQQTRCCSARAVAGSPSSSSSSPSPLLVVVRRSSPAPRRSVRPAAFGLGGGGGNNKPSSSDAMASAAAEAEAAAAKVGEAVSEAGEVLATQVAAEAAEAGAEGASSALSPSPAAAAKEAAASSLPPAPVRSAGRSQTKTTTTRGKLLSLPQFAQQQRRPTTLAGRRARGLARVLLYAGVAYALLSLGAAVMKVARRVNSPRAQRLRTVDRNKRVVEALNSVFLDSPTSEPSTPSTSTSTTLTPALMRKLRSETGFSGAEVFRKYLWYLLRERRFDSTAVADLVSLRGALELSDEDVASALKERAQRIYDKYGNVMLDVAGMSKAGIERKATCRALFSKLLFLAEAEELLDQSSGSVASSLDIPGVFGATEDDAAKLRIVSLLEVDLGKLEDQFPSSSGGSGGGDRGFFGDLPDEGGSGSGGGNGGNGGGGGGW